MTEAPSSWRARARQSWAEGLALAGVMAVALVVRLVKLGSIPRTLVYDEMQNLQSAYQIAAGTGPGVFGFDWKPAPIASLYPLAWTVQVFGDSVTDYRLFAVGMSIVTIALFYALARESMAAVAAIAAMAMLATNLWFLHFSRSAWENMNAPLFALGACWAATRALKAHSLWWWAACGAFCALGLYGYFAGRFIFVSVAIVGAMAVALKQTAWRETASGLAVAAFVCALLFAPMARNVVEHWDFFNKRTGDVSVFSHQNPYGEPYEGWAGVRRNVVRNARGFLLMDPSQMDRGLWYRYSPRHRPPLDWLAASLFFAGGAVALVRWRRSFAWWPFFAPLFIVEAFSLGTPDLARGLIIAPFYFLFIGLAFDEALAQARARPLLAQTAALAGVAVITTAAAVVNVRGYFDWQRDEVTQGARMPGIDICEWRLWRGLAQDAAERGTRWDLDRFERERRALDCSAIVRHYRGFIDPQEAATPP